MALDAWICRAQHGYMTKILRHLLSFDPFITSYPFSTRSTLRQTRVSIADKA
ncbi:hypothetical protein CLV29_1377 [Naumannella halotolerans]|uniref:Uncharacterized protein n=1 Tax=Naumannella halotolerans TaxID=993414 RepID=A0A4V3ENH0_9ACTN|nr:hypothetical protein CLV29_1377 [Naumannella halotolerans]